MKCYYEELNVPQDASEADVKTAYRKLALRWHPDKNLECLEEAKEKFQLIQQAYEVLSDPHERAWYDKHRDEILRGKNSDYEENSLDLFQYFTVSCFKGYDDGPKGFYAVYNQVFETLAAEDAEFMDDEEEILAIPKFGNSQSNYEEVVAPFYAYWQSYCTKKTYTWRYKYDVTEIRERRLVREIEKENKKIAQKARKERNEEVRNLVAFVRKRDKRVAAYKAQLEAKAAMNRQKQEELRKEQIRKRQLELQQMQASIKKQGIHEEYEQQLKQLEQQYHNTSDEDCDSDEADENDLTPESADNAGDSAGEEEIAYIDDLFCVACNKAFKNENAFANHESSKKHRDNVERLRQEMQEEEEAFTHRAEKEDESAEAEDVAEEFESKIELNGSVEESAELPNRSKGKKSKKAKKNIKVAQGSDLSDDDHVDEFLTTASLNKSEQPSDNDDDNNWSTGPKKAGKKAKAKKQSQSQAQAQTQSAKASAAVKTAQESAPAPHSTCASKDVEQAQGGVREDSAKKSNEPQVCITCHAEFPSKNKLFAHLKALNHGVYIPKAKADAPPESAAQKRPKGKRK